MKNTIALISLIGPASAARLPKPTSERAISHSNKNNKIGASLGNVASGGILLVIKHLLNQGDEQEIQPTVNAAQAPQKRSVRRRIRFNRKRPSRRPDSAPDSPKVDNAAKVDRTEKVDDTAEVDARGGKTDGFAKEVAKGVLSDEIVNRIEDVIDVVKGKIFGRGGEDDAVDDAQENSPVQKRDLLSLSALCEIFPTQGAYFGHDSGGRQR